MPEIGTASMLEPYVLLAHGAKNAAAIGLVQQVLEAPGVYVFGELLDHPNIKDLETNTSTPNAKAYHDLLNLFAYGTFEEYSSAQPQLPALTEPMKKKLRLLTIATIATKEKTIKYEHMQRVLEIDSIRELEDLIIEGANNSVLKGKLDQKSKHFEVDYAMGRDIRKVEFFVIIGKIDLMYFSNKQAFFPTHFLKKKSTLPVVFHLTNEKFCSPCPLHVYSSLLVY